MPVNKRESLIFTVLMCAFMVYVMTLYNIERVNGVSTSLFSEAWLGFPIAYAVAFISDWFIWGKHAKRIAFKIIGRCCLNETLLLMILPCIESNIKL